MAALMYDSDNETYPAGVRYIAAYVDGSRTGGNYSRAKAKYPNAGFLTISAVGAADADVIDIEPGCVWPVEAAIPWLRRQLAAGRTPIFYCNTSTAQACYSAFSAAGLPVLPWWRADYRAQYATNPPGALTAGEIAWQYANPAITGNHWDVSLISDQLQAHIDGNPTALQTAVSGATPITIGGAVIGGALQEEDVTEDDKNDIAEKVWTRLLDGNRMDVILAQSRQRIEDVAGGGAAVLSQQIGFEAGQQRADVIMANTLSIVTGLAGQVAALGSVVQQQAGGAAVDMAQVQAAAQAGAKAALADLTLITKEN